MVWPILISVEVTPRISADIAASGSIRQVTATSAPAEVTKRIGIPPLCRQPRLTARGAAGIWLRREGTCHDAALDANPNRGGRSAKGWSQASTYLKGSKSRRASTCLPEPALETSAFGVKRTWPD